MKRLYAFVFVALVPPLLGQTGKTRDELVAAFGEPKNVGGGRERFSDAGFHFYPSYEDGICWRFRFTLKNKNPLAEAKEHLHRKSEGKSWELTGLTEGDTRAKWMRSDGLLTAELTQETEGHGSRDDYETWEVNYLTIIDEKLKASRTERLRSQLRTAEEKARKRRPWILGGFALFSGLLWKRRNKLSKKTLGGLCIVGVFVVPYLGIMAGLINPFSSIPIVNLAFLLWIVVGTSVGITICQSPESSEST